MHSPERVPRVASLNALVHEIGVLRGRLETDLTVTAAALEDGALHVADDLLGQDRDLLAAFQAQSLKHLQALPAVLVPRSRRRARALAVSVPVAAAVAMVLLVAAGREAPTPVVTAQASVDEQYLELEELARSRAGEDDVRAASGRLAASVRDMSARIRSDPAAATAALGLLRAEERLLAAQDGGSLDDLRDRNQDLTQTVLDALPVEAPRVRATPSVAPIPPSPSPSPSPAPAPREPSSDQPLPP